MKITVSRLKELINEELKLANEGNIPPGGLPTGPKKKSPGETMPTNPHDEPVELEESPGHKRGPHAKQGRRATLDSGERTELEESPGHKRGPHAKQGRRATLDSGEREELISEEHSDWPYPEQHGEFPRGLTPDGLDILTQLNMPAPWPPQPPMYQRGGPQPSWEDALAADRAGKSWWNPQAWGIDTPYPKGTEWGPLSLEEKRRYPDRLEGHPAGQNRIRLEEFAGVLPPEPEPWPGGDWIPDDVPPRPVPPTDWPRLPGGIPEEQPDWPPKFPRRPPKVPDVEPPAGWSLEEQVAKVVDYYTNQIMENQVMKETSPEYQDRLNEEDQEDVFPSKQLPTKKVKSRGKEEKKVKPPSLEEHIAAYIDQVMEQTMKDIGGGRQAECGPKSCRILPKKETQSTETVKESEEDLHEQCDERGCIINYPPRETKPKSKSKETPDGTSAPSEQSTETVKEGDDVGKDSGKWRKPKKKKGTDKPGWEPKGNGEGGGEGKWKKKKPADWEEPPDVTKESEEPALEVNETLAGWYNKTLFESLTKKWSK